MDDRSTFRIPAHWERLELFKARATLAVLTVVAAATVALIVSLVPHSLVLPALSLAAFGGAGLTAATAWTVGARRSGDRVTLWDISGALTLIGCAAGMLSTPANVLQLFGHAVVP